MSAGGLFTGNQMLEMAIQMEQDGQAFYLAAAENASAPEVTELCRHFADQEVAHEQTFRKMLDEAQGSEQWHESYEGEHAGYIEALLHGRALPSAAEGERLARESESGLDVLEFALQFEKDSVLFYSEMLEFAKGPYRDTVERIIAEEKVHVVGLRKMIQQRQ